MIWNIVVAMSIEYLCIQLAPSMLLIKIHKLITFSAFSFQYRNQLSLQQDARLHLQREALQQRQAELRSVDQRILELQNRLHKKKASNLVHPSGSSPLQQQQQPQQNSIFTNNNGNNIPILTSNATIK